MKVACVRVPHFPVQVERLHRGDLRDRPLIIVRGMAEYPTVFDCSSDAHGVQSGMPLAEALSHCPQATLLEPDHHLYATHFDALLEALGQVSPLVEPNPPDAAYVGLDGLERLYGGEGNLLRKLLEALPTGLVGQVGVAAAKFPATLASLAASPGQSRCIPKDAPAFLSSFPVEVLPTGWQTIERLRGFGLRTLGKVAALPMAAMQAQFGPEGRRLWELSRGIDPSPLLPRQPEETVTETTAFPTPVVSLGPMLLAVEMLLGRAFSRPAMRGRCARVAALKAEVYRGPTFLRRVVFKPPKGEKAGAFFALRSALENVRLPGPLESLGITLSGLAGNAVRQESFYAEVRRREQLREAVQHIRQAMGGKTALYNIRRVEPWSRIPERRMALVEYDP